jgi:hypothetical protein
MPTQKSFDVVLALFDTKPEYDALDLLKCLKSKGMAESEIKEAVAYLINDNQIEMTPDLHLRSIATQVHG